MYNLTNQEMMQSILAICLLAGGYVLILQAITSKAANKRAVPVIAVFLLVVYGGIAAVTYMTFRNSGTMDVFLIAVLLLFALAIFIMIVVYIIRNHEYMSLGAVILFLLYLFAVLYMTMLGRQGKTIDTVLMQPFESVSEAIATHSLEPMRHFFLNIVMFVPVGFLFAMIDPEELYKLKYAIPAGLFFSVVIESVQLILHKGQADIDDVIANVLGAVVGLIFYRIFHRIGADEL